MEPFLSDEDPRQRPRDDPGAGREGAASVDAAIRAAALYAAGFLAFRAGRVAVVCVFAAFAALAGIFQLPPIDRDETRFAQATAQMLETGDIVRIRFLDEERNKKPSGAYWLQAASVKAFSDAAARSIWAYRLPSALAVILSAAFVMLAGERMFGPGPGLLAGILLAAAPIAAAEATLAKTDAALLAATAGALLAFVEIISRVADGKPVPRNLPTLFWVAIGVGTLLKGPVIMLVAGPAVALCAWRFRFIDVVPTLRPAIGVAIVVAMILPWTIAVSVATEGRFLAEAVGRDMLGKIGAAQETHGGLPGYHLLALWLLFWPAAPLIADAVARAISARDRWRWFLLIAWSAPAWVFFEVTATKLPHYTLPLYPAIAIASAAAALEKRANGNPGWRRRWGARAYFCIGVAIAGIIAAVPFAGDIARTFAGAEAPRIHSSLSALTCAGFALLLVAASGAIALDYFRGRTWRPALSASGLSAVLTWTMLSVVLPSLSPLTLSQRLAAAIDAGGVHALRDGAPGTILVGYTEPSAVFLLGSNTAILPPSAAARAAVERSGGAIVIEEGGLAEFLAAAVAEGVSVRRISSFDDLNYSNGRRARLTVYAIE